MLPAPVAAAVTGKKRPVPVTIFLGQSWSTWARDASSELPLTPANDANAKIWNHATSQIVPLVYGPLAGGGNEQQPGNSWIDSSFQSGIGWLWTYFQEIAANGGSTFDEHVFGWSIGGSMYVSTGSFGADGDWTPGTAGSAYQDALASYRAFTAALAAVGKRPVPKFVYTDLGINSASDASASTFETDHGGTFLARLVTDGVIAADTPIYQLRYSDKLAGANKATVRTAEVNLATKNPSRFLLMNGDGYQPLAEAGVHPTAGYLASLGQHLALKRLRIPHPLDNIAEMGATQYAVRRWALASFEAGLATSNTEVQTAYETSQSTVNTNNMVNSTATQRPLVVAATLANGVPARFASFDGSNDALFNGNAAAINQSAGFGFFAAVRATAAANAVLYSEANDGNGTPFWGFKSDASGNLCITLRDDASAVPLSLASFGTVAFDNTTTHFIAAWYDGATNFNAQIDATACPNTLTYTKTAITLNNSSFGAQKVGGTLGGFMTIARLGEVVITKYAATGWLTFVAQMRAYMQREYGCP